jgi:predicted TIM-barrel fold metal-dependent hydrolase
MSMIRSLPNVSVEISRFVIVDGIGRIIRAVGDQRILFGSRFPDSPMVPQLYSLHRNDLTQTSLSAICSGNLERLLEGQ